MLHRNNHMRLLLVLVCLLLAPFAAPFAALAQHTSGAPEMIDGPQTTPKTATLNNDSVIKMAKAGLGDDLILQTINTQPGQYVLDADSLVALKQADISDRVIAAMMQKSRKLLTPPPPEKRIDLSDVNEIGVYYKDREGRWIAIEPEVLQIKSGGFIKSTVTNGIIKQDRNGHLKGRESKLALQRPIQILIYVPEGVGPTEYNFLRFRLNSNSREFRVFTGGVFHSSSGADRDDVPFHATKTAARTYEFTIDQTVPGGEYGILPPGTGNASNGGKIYTFAIVE
jgi:hypothetical protein